MTTIATGVRVRLHPRSTGPATGVGEAGTVVSVRECASSVTGARLRWIYVDVRLDSGFIVTREPRELSPIEPVSR